MGDIGKNYIHVCRTEVEVYEKDKPKRHEVRDFPKTENSIRNVYIPDKYLWILNCAILASSFGQYLFERNGKRIKASVFRYRLKYICKKYGLASKSPHKIRKTYGTILVNDGVEESMVKSQMEHKNIQATMKYYYKDMMSEDKKIATINKVSAL